MKEILEIFALGGARFARDGRTLAGLTSRKAQALLIYLAANGGPQGREVLAELLWDERSQTNALTNLRGEIHQLRRVIGPAVVASRHSLELDMQNVRFDVEILRTTCRTARQLGVYDQKSSKELGSAVGLYRGDFLVGFHLREASGFEAWLELERDSLRQQVLEALQQLVDFHVSRGSYGDGLVHARRQLRLDPLLESAQRQAMWLFAVTDQKAAALDQYAAFRRLLNDELGVEPSEETLRLSEEIECGRLRRPVNNRIGRVQGFDPVDHQWEAITGPTFAGRERELERLDSQLHRVLKGSGDVIFVSGEAGSGKTTLMKEFARRALSAHADLLVASGSGNAYSGAGDPYLPFRDLLRMLLGDIEGISQSGAINREHGRRLWLAGAPMAQDLLESAPDLIDVLVPDAIVREGLVRSPDGVELTRRLDGLAERRTALRDGLYRPLIFEQFTAALRALAQRQPLVLLLDDMQWFDGGSINLLFHLARTLRGDRILILGAYRPSEVALTTAEGAGHPLKPVVAELLSNSGEAGIDLEHFDSTAARAFVDALVDREANSLDVGFRDSLYRHTRGHPLFASELLVSMEERGELTRDEHGRLAKGLELDWNRLPAKVEAVIEQRLGRLDDRHHRILSVASIAGEEFSAQLIARVCGGGELETVRSLSQVLAKRHNLVLPTGETRSGETYLSGYRFAHVLFQQYLYGTLDPNERRLLHREIAAALEELQSDDFHETSVQLAHHYLEGGEGARAAQYLKLTGDRARALASLDQAVDYYRRALSSLPEERRRERAETERALGECLLVLGSYRKAVESLEAGLKLFESLRDVESAGAIQRLLGRVHWEQGDRLGAWVHYNRALALLETTPDGIELTRTVSAVSQMHMLASEYDLAITWGKRALRLAEQQAVEDVRVHSLNNLGVAYCGKGRPRRGLTMLRGSLERSLELGLAHDACRAYSNAGEALELYCCRYEEARSLFEEMLTYAKRIHADMFFGVALCRLTNLDWLKGNWTRALERSDELGEWMQNEMISVPRVWASTLLGTILNQLGQPEAARRQLESELDAARSVAEPQTTVPHLAQLAQAQIALGLDDEAASNIEALLALIRANSFNHPSSALPLLFICRWSISVDEVRAKALTSVSLSYLEKLNEQIGSQETKAAHLEAKGVFLAANDVRAEAASHLHAAAKGWESLGRSYDQARSLVPLVRVLDESGFGSRAEDCAAKASKILEALSSQLPDTPSKQTFSNAFAAQA